MKRFYPFVLNIAFCLTGIAQPGSAITSWLQNTTGMGSYYQQGNYTSISNNIPFNCQQVH